MTTNDPTILDVMAAGEPCSPWLAATFCVFHAPAGWADPALADSAVPPPRRRA